MPKIAVVSASCMTPPPSIYLCTSISSTTRSLASLPARTAEPARAMAGIAPALAGCLLLFVAVQLAAGASPASATAETPAASPAKSLPSAVLSKASGAAHGVIGTLEAGAAGTLGLIKGTLGAKGKVHAGAPAMAPGAGRARKHGGHAMGPAAGSPEHGAGGRVEAPEYGEAAAMGPDAAAGAPDAGPGHKAFVMEIGASSPGEEAVEEGPAGAPGAEAEAEAESKATAPSASEAEGPDAASPDAGGSGEAETFPPDAPIAGEAPMAKVTPSSDNSQPATEASAATAISEGPAASAEAPGPGADDEASGGASVVASSHLIGALALFASVVSALATL
ncbi:skin secretory protein xP2-like [Brachypodium distachyon]|uniref:skin secretory protein xP2-like n=1 Tax=Brachypodium distachyon TaxID=15368 RepID=UPI00052FE6F2|nr:skin secretory protein xP2-like [Brachypodium distachyon]|eukprot:XP_010239396.1 skin secretory protein xP2-like [Brachypodium distachyon]